MRRHPDPSVIMWPMIGAVAAGEVFSIIVGALFLAGIARLLLRERRARATWSVVRSEPVICEFDGIRVQINPGDPVRQATLKSAGLDHRVVVHAHSLQIGGWYSLEAGETTMESSRGRYGWHDRDCIMLTGTYGGVPARLALFRKGNLQEIWSAFQTAGVRAVSGPPTE